MIDLVVMLAAAIFAPVETGQSQERIAVMVARQRAILIDAGVTGCRGRSTGDEIIVCGKEEIEPSPPPPPRRQALEVMNLQIGAPPAGMGTGVGVTMRGCFLQKCPKKFVLIDLSKIPEAPLGSDADLIARGLMPDR